MAATRSSPSVFSILLFKIPDGFGEAPLIDVDRIIARTEDASAADLLARRLHRRLVAQPSEEVVHEPAGDEVALAWIDEPEVEQRHEQHFPIELHVIEQLPPIDSVMAFEDHVRDIGGVVAMVVLNEDLRPDELGRGN